VIYSIREVLLPFVLALAPFTVAVAEDESLDSSRTKVAPSPASTGVVAGPGSQASQSASDRGKSVPEADLLTAVRDGLVSVKAVGRGDGRMTLSLTNRSRRPLRVVLPPGIIAQSATGQFGGMGGMGGGGMGGGMGGGGMGGGMGGMGGGMGGGGMGGGMGGMGGMGMQSGTMPSTMGMMMLSRMIMYFCGDPESWDPRSIMVGMMGGGMGGGMGGMGGGMMGGMGGGMGGMGGGMRSVPPSALPSALLSAGQTRHLPTRLVSITGPAIDGSVGLPEKDEPLRIIGDVTRVTKDLRVQKALKRLTATMAPTSLSQLVMWRLAGGLDWDTISLMSQKWANEYELTLAKDFVEHLDALPEGETGRLLIQVDGKDATGKPIAMELSQLLSGKTVLGLKAQVGEIPSRPDGPAVACRVRLSGNEAMVQVSSSDALAGAWVNFGKFTVPVTHEKGKAEVLRLADGLSEGILNRLVRAQIIKGSATKDKGKLVYQLRIDNASPLVLNGLAMLGTASKEEEIPKVLPMISVSPRKSLTVPTNDDVVRGLGLKKGIKLIALDLSGL
jgi:hypothetical protein